YWHSGDPASLDPNVGIGTNRLLKNMTNSLFAQVSPGYLEAPDFTVIPDLAESWEFSGDKLQLTMHLRQGVKWHNLPPVNGRPLDREDILFSWERLKRVNSNRAALVNEINPAAPILSLTMPDPRTVVIKLAFPLSYIMTLIAE